MFHVKHPGGEGRAGVLCGDGRGGRPSCGDSRAFRAGGRVSRSGRAGLPRRRRGLVRRAARPFRCWFDGEIAAKRHGSRLAHGFAGPDRIAVFRELGFCRSRFGAKPFFREKPMHKTRFLPVSAIVRVAPPLRRSTCVARRLNVSASASCAALRACALSGAAGFSGVRPAWVPAGAPAALREPGVRLAERDRLARSVRHAGKSSVTTSVSPSRRARSPMRRARASSATMASPSPLPSADLARSPW